MKIKQAVLLAFVFGFICFQSLRVEAAESKRLWRRRRKAS